jgi:hypothetical protein
VLALLSKETGVTAVGVALIYDVITTEGAGRFVLPGSLTPSGLLNKRRVAMLFVTAVSLFARIYYTGTSQVRRRSQALNDSR